MTIGRISGPLLKENLLREGQNLRFENDLLVLKVDESNPTDHKVGIKNSNPAYTLDIGGTVRSTVTRTGQAIIDDIEINGATITTSVGNLTLDSNGNNVIIDGNISLYNVTSTGATGTDKIVFSQSPTFSGTLVAPNANGIAIGTPTLGALTGAVQLTTNSSVTDSVAQLNAILTLLSPAQPTAFPGGQLLTISGTTQRIINTPAGSQVLNGTGVSAPTAGTIIYVSRANTLATNTLTTTGPGTAGTVTVSRNGSSAVSKTLTFGNTTQIITASITGTTLGSSIVTFTPPTTGLLQPGYIVQTAASGAFGGLTINTVYYISAVTSTTLTLAAYNTVTGSVGAAFSATSTSSGTLGIVSSNDNGTFTANNTSLVITNNIAYPIDTPGFYETVDLAVNGTSVPAGWNTVQISHTGASTTTIGATTTNNGIWYYDNSSTVAPTFGSQTFAIGTSNLTYSSTIPHYNSSTTYNIGFTVTWNAGQTGHPSAASNILTTSAVGPWTSAGNKTYTNLGLSTLPTSTAVTAGSGPNGSIFSVNVISGFGAWTTTTTVPIYTADNSYTTATTSLPALNAIILYKTGTTSSTTFIDETNIFFNSAVGGSTSPGGLRCVNPDVGVASQDTPVFVSGATAFNSTTGPLYNTDAILVGVSSGSHVIKHDRTNYGSGFLPTTGGPNLSSRSATDPQYFTFRFVRSGVSKFSITYTTTTGVAAIFCAMPGTGGTSGTTSTLNKWLDLRIDNSLTNGCALGGNMNPATTGTVTYNCSFGTLSSTNATNNEIWVRIKLSAGQSITSLYLGASTV